MITAIIQARMGSSRLPKKVMKPLANHPLIYHVVVRAKAAKRLEQVIVATTTDPSDDPLVEYLTQLGVTVFRGSVNDVLDRYYQAALTHQASVIVRLTGDCPVLDPALIDQTIGLYMADQYDYVSNFMHRTYPDGLDTEVFSFAALYTAWRDAKLPSEREHVTPYLYKHPEKFFQVGLISPIDLSHYRWTVDEPADFDFISILYDRLYAENPLFDMGMIHALLEADPNLLKLNQDIPTNEGYTKSLQADPKHPSFYDDVRTFVHDTALPLTAVRGYADLILKHKQGKLTLTEDEQVKFLGLIKSNATTLAAFILNMGEIVRFEKDPALEWEAIQARDIIEKMLEIAARSDAPKRNIKVDGVADGDLPRLWADLERLHRTMQRLLENAIAYTPSDGQIILTATLSSDEKSIIFSVQDTGVGIAEDQQEKVFKRYWRGDHPEVRNVPGSGMGLSIAKLYVEAMGGKIWFESTLGQGTIFYVQLGVVTQ